MIRNHKSELININIILNIMKESERILEKYPNRIPIIVNRKKDSNIADIGKSKLLDKNQLLTIS